MYVDYVRLVQTRVIVVELSHAQAACRLSSDCDQVDGICAFFSS